MKRIDELIQNNKLNYLYPFFWQHGETNEKIKEYIEKIEEQGIHSLCIESRPHPDFLEDGWWASLDFILDEARKRNMKIWILDDAKFPTGYANGKVPAELKKRYLNYHRFDIIGSSKEMELDMSKLCGFRDMMKDKRHMNDVLFKVILIETDPRKQNVLIEGTQQDITNDVKNNILYLSLERKHYSVFALYVTECGEEEATKDYLDPMRKESTQILLNEVYEKHYQRYKDDFRHTITAFFSDEPRFGNVKGSDYIIGQKQMPLPWNELVDEKLKRIDEFHDTDYIFLFEGESDNASFIRYQYMNIVSQLYSENFSQMIGQWCEEHGVQYVGHVIEDNNAHARLGYGPGHYFRGIAGQHVAGIDIIGGQVVPGMDYHHDAFSTGGSDGEFYHYALCKMGASAAKLDPKKTGMLMCEAFGAYGWIEGLKMMKWITDHMISHGVNLIVPHAFDPKEFPDWDCPPHFYAHGNNPQYPYFHYWSQYAQRLCHLMSGGNQECKVGVLYHAFAEWSGETMYMQKVLKQLQQHQIDCNVISEDYLDEITVSNHQMLITHYAYDVLIVPYAKRLPQNILHILANLSKEIELIFIEDYPQNYHGNGEVVTIEELTNHLIHVREVSLTTFEPSLVYYHYHHDDGEVYMFSNESILDDVNTVVDLEEVQKLMIYDAYTNRTYQLKTINDHQFELHLKPYESLVLVTGQSQQLQFSKGELLCELDHDFQVSMKEFNKKEFHQPFHLDMLKNLGKDYCYFTGQIKYECEVELQQKDVLLHIIEAYEIVEVFVNGINCGARICPEYTFDISKAIQIGKNQIEIIVTNNLCRNQRDGTSMYMPLEPLGIVDKLQFFKKKEGEE